MGTIQLRSFRDLVVGLVAAVALALILSVPCSMVDGATLLRQTDRSGATGGMHE